LLLYIGVLADDEAQAEPGTIEEAHLEALDDRSVACCIIREGRGTQAGTSWTFETGQVRVCGSPCFWRRLFHPWFWFGASRTVALRVQ
jgi:hypothetical protein